MASPFNPSDYTTPPATDVPGAITLASSLLTSKPKDAPAQVKAAAKALKTSLAALEKAWGKRTAAAPVTVDVRAVDHRVDTVWGACHRRLDSLAELAPTGAPRAVRAAATRDAIFGTKEPLGFLTIKYRVEWAEVKKRLQRIDEGGHAASLDDLAGPEFLPEMRASFVAYGKALGVTEAAAVAPDADSLLPLLRELQRDIGDYAIAVLGMRVKGDAERLAVVRAALKPIDDHRAASARAGAAQVADPGAPPPAPDAQPAPGQ
jgi:hypothetical protein